jgi:DNA-binding Lrp family transcriptional regulator
LLLFISETLWVSGKSRTIFLLYDVFRRMNSIWCRNHARTRPIRHFAAARSHLERPLLACRTGRAEEGLIEGYQAVLGLKALGLGTTVMVRITLESQSEDALETFERAVVKCASVVRCLLMSGSDDYLVTVIARDIEDFERIHTSQLSRLPRVSRIQSSFAIRNVVNRSFPPAALLPPGKGR